MANMTLRELCQESGASRRAIQGYEKMGLVSPTSKNKYGYLIYDDAAQKRIKKIKMYQKIGLSLKEIVDTIDAPNDRKVVVLEKQLLKLQLEEKEMGEIIEETKFLIERLKKS